MSIPRSGVLFKRSGGEVAAITKHLKSLTLRPAKRVTITFDPFDARVRHTRDFLFHLSGPKVIATNPSCAIRTNVVCDRREPTVDIKLLPEFADKFGSEQLILKTSNLTCLDIVQLINKHITPLVPPEKPTEETQTKLTKSKARKK